MKFEQNRMFKIKRNFEFLTGNRVFPKLVLTRIDAISEDVPGGETIVECYNINFKTTIFQRSKYYGSPTRARIIRLKFASSMADPIVLDNQ